MKYLFLDTETGGLGLDKSLLTGYFLICDEDFKDLDELSLILKPNDGIYHIMGESTQINKINLIEHNPLAITYKEAGTKLYNFLNKNCTKPTETIAIGHGIKGDIEQITDKLISRNNWDKFISYKNIDTQSLTQFFLIKQKIPNGISGSLESLGNLFGLNTNGLHDAKVDTILTKEVFLKFLELF